MKIKKYTNGAWTDLDKPVKKYASYTDEATTLPLTIEASATDAVDNYQVYGASGGVGEATSGSEPSGYKIPILNTSGVTENLFDVDDLIKGRLDDGVIGHGSGTSNLQVSGTNVSFTTNTSYRGVVTYSRIAVTAGTYTLQISGYDSTTINTITRKVAYYTDDGTFISQITIGNSWIINNGKAIFQFPVSQNGTIRIALEASNAGTYTMNNIMLVKGSTPPDHYIPHRYESNYDLFIGDSKLYEDEYLDFVEQKLYKRTKQLFDYKTMAPINERGKYLKQNGDTRNATSWAVTDYIPLNDTSITLSLMSNIGSAPSLCVYDQNKSYLDGMEYNGQSTKKLNITGAAYARFSYIWDNTVPATSTIDKIMLNSGSTAEPFAPYYNPTDPPVPLPPIPTYIGKNSIDVDTTTAPDKVVVEYQGWKPAGDGEVKYYHNGWVNTPPPAKPSWLSDGYEAVLDAQTAPEQFLL